MNFFYKIIKINLIFIKKKQLFCFSFHFLILKYRFLLYNCINWAVFIFTSSLNKLRKACTLKKKNTYSRCIWVCVSLRERMEDKRTHELPELYAPNGGEGPYSYSQNSNYQVFFNIYNFFVHFSCHSLVCLLKASTSCMKSVGN